MCTNSSGSALPCAVKKHGAAHSNPQALEPQCRQECTPCAFRLVKHSFRVRAINLELPRFASEPLQGPLHYSAPMAQCAKTEPRIRQTAAHIPGIFGLLSE